MDTTYIEAVSKLQLVLFSRLCEEALRCAASPSTTASESCQRCGHAVGAEQSWGHKVSNCGDQKGRADEVEEDEKQREPDDGSEGWRISETPGEGCE